ncbi:MAG TPA: hypothetical protein VG944_11850 [Fimbriimonas sp.]|nr:hypothetical protein [Fimbriimonas sp.]
MKPSPLDSFIRSAVLFACLAGALTARAAGPIEVSVKNLYWGHTVADAWNPQTVELTNKGPEAAGSILCGPSGNEISYPFHLRSGERQTIVTYPPIDEMHGVLPIRVKATPVGTTPTRQNVTDISTEIRAVTLEDKAHYLLISSLPYGLEYLELGSGKATGMENKADGVTIQPASALDRRLAYKSFRAVLLGTGSAKLSDSAIDGLKLYLLGGGKIVFGKLDDSAYGDARWRGILPRRGIPTSFGLGCAIYLPYSFEGKARTEDAELRSKVLTGLGQGYSTSGNRLGSISRDPNLKDQTAQAKATDDPFATKLPPFGNVLGIMCGYFLMVVPLNLLLLRKLRRVELTWITAPVLSIAFAAVMFRSASSLYSSPTSRALKGALVFQEGSDQGMFFGTADLFFPHASTVALNLRDVDDFGASDTDIYYSQFGLARQSDNLPLRVDTGAVDVPQLSSGNLGFRRFSFTQRFSSPAPNSNLFDFSIAKPTDDIYPVTVTNRSPYTVTAGNVICGRIALPIGDLAPGQSKTVQIVPIFGVPSERVLPNGSSGMDSGGSNETQNPQGTVEDVVKATGTLSLVGTCNDIPVGPQTGKLVQGRTEINLIAFAPTNIKWPK